MKNDGGREPRSERVFHLLRIVAAEGGAAEGLISLSKAAELLRPPVAQVEAGLKGPQTAHA
jgi:hypothetical protein